MNICFQIWLASELTICAFVIGLYILNSRNCKRIRSFSFLLILSFSVNLKLIFGNIIKYTDTITNHYQHISDENFRCDLQTFHLSMMEVDSAVNVTKKAFPNKVQGNAQSKKASKPLMEKKRRERINYSLAALKIILNNTISNHEKVKTKKSKIEKADILEMAVRQFRVIRTFEQSDLNKYTAGFVDCAAEIIRFLNSPEILSLCSSDALGSNLKSLLIQHLELCSHEMTKELSEQAPSVNQEEPNNNISPMIESSPELHDNAKMAPPILQEKMISPLLNKHSAYLNYKDLFRDDSGHISPPDSGDESIRAARQHALIIPNIVDMSNPLPILNKTYNIGTASNYVDYITSFPASIWPYLITNQYCTNIQPEFFDCVNSKQNNISTLEEYIGAAVEEAIHEKPLLEANTKKISDTSRNRINKKTNPRAHKSRTALHYTENDQVINEMPIDYSLKSDAVSSNDEPAVIEYLDPLSPMWRPW